MTIYSKQLSVDYDQLNIIDNIDIIIPKNQITSIIGPNGCGKSTLLKAMANIIHYRGETVVNDRNIQHYSRRELARVLSMLPQKPSTTNGLTVEELVTYGRHPYTTRFSGLDAEDLNKIKWAMEATDILAFKNKKIDTLSGGQRQRVWIAMSLAQDTEIIFLDEPTTYLDIAHQLEVLEILVKLKTSYKKTIVMVIHDLNQASKYSDHLIAMKQGEIIATGSSEHVIQKNVLRRLFNIEADIRIDKQSQKPLCLSFDLIS